MPLTIAFGGARYVSDSRERAAFQRANWIRLPALVDDAVLRRIDARLLGSAFAEMRHDGVGAGSADLRLLGPAASELLVLLCNDPAVLRGIEDITGCAPLTRFNGSIYRMLPEAGHRQEWHDDLVDGRLVTLSVNLSTSNYDGGVLEIRDRRTRLPVARIPNTGKGDAVLFKLDSSLEHRVTPVTAGVKTAFAGWFRRGTPLGEELRRGSIELDS
jgi:hypothetical protein